jgi:hypothetical protein
LNISITIAASVGAIKAANVNAMRRVDELNTLAISQ